MKATGLKKTMISGLLCLATIQVGTAQGLKTITLEDIWLKNTFKVKSVPGFNAMKDGKRYTQLDNEGGVVQVNSYELATGTKKGNLLQAPAYEGKPIAVEEYTLSSDEKKMLLLSENQPIYRHSILHRVYVYDLATQKTELLDTAKVLHASFSPDGSKVAFVKDNNLWYRDLRSGKTVQVTSDGRKNEIINGNCDWVYEEEFSFTQAYQWSPDGKTLAYYRFDESKVKEFTIPFYEGGDYPRNYTYKYPKAGEDNSEISIFLYNLANGTAVSAPVTKDGASRDFYIPRIKWTRDPAKLCIYKLNRLQNKLELFLADAASGRTELIYTESDPSYIEINDNLYFLPDGQSFVFTSEQSGYDQLYRWNWKKQEITRLTEGSEDIESVNGFDEKRKQVWYTVASGTMQRKLYTVSWNGGTPRCLTPEDGTHVVTTCEGYNYFLDKHSMLTQPPVFTLRDEKGKIIRTLEDNVTLRSTMQSYALGKIRFLKVKGTDKDLNAWMITPPDFSENKKYPVLLYQYSGPGSQGVLDRFPVFDFFWHQMLAEKGYIVVCVDGTGTGSRGADFRKKTYLQLGKYESEDQMAAARYLGGLPYVDKSRIGIWGWSYGGFISSTCLFKGQGLFKAAIAVAPVSNWRYYDNIYTERYMRKPQDNASGYDDNSPVNMAKNMSADTRLLLVHGTADDNVHFQNSAVLVTELVKNGKEFDSEYYPNKQHSLLGSATRFHLYRRMTEFILANL